MWRLRGDANAHGSEDHSARDAVIADLQIQLKPKDAHIAVVKSKFNSVVFAFVVFVLGLVAENCYSSDNMYAM